MDYKWEELTEEMRHDCYQSYIADIVYENGDNAPHLTYEEWCRESKIFGFPLCPSV